MMIRAICVVLLSALTVIAQANTESTAKLREDVNKFLGKEPASDGMSLRARWTKWAVVGKKSGEFEDVGLTSEVSWRLHLSTLTREETVSAKQPVTIRRWWLIVPTSYGTVETRIIDGVRVDRFSTKRAMLEVKLSESSFAVQTSIMATGEVRWGKAWTARFRCILSSNRRR
jgi:hypothetical protein